jgi:hypothetical protein
MCSTESRNRIFRPVSKNDASFLQQIFPSFSCQQLLEMIGIMTDGINTEIVTTISVLLPTHDILTGNIEGDGWRSSGADVLFSAIGKDSTSKYQTRDMQLLHDVVIPFLATENMRELRSYFKKNFGVHAFFMHSCGDERFPAETWNTVKKLEMQTEQFLRTKIDWGGKLFLVNKEEIFTKAQISEKQLGRITSIMKYAKILSEKIVHA